MGFNVVGKEGYDSVFILYFLRVVWLKHAWLNYSNFRMQSEGDGAGKIHLALGAGKEQKQGEAAVVHLEMTTTSPKLWNYI